MFECFLQPNLFYDSMFKVSLVSALSKWKMSLPTAGKLDCIIFEDALQSEPFCDSVMEGSIRKDICALMTQLEI